MWAFPWLVSGIIYLFVTVVYNIKFIKSFILD